METVARVTLTVKGTEADVARRLAAWFVEFPDMIPGYGYPDGTLLHYRIDSTVQTGK